MQAIDLHLSWNITFPQLLLAHFASRNKTRCFLKQFLWNSIDRCIIKLKEWRVHCKSLLQGRASVYEGCYRMHPCVYYLSTRVSENEIGSFRKTKNSACNNSSKILRPNFPENMNSEHLKKINLKNVITYSNLSLGLITVYLENFRLSDQIRPNSTKFIFVQKFTLY